MIRIFNVLMVCTSIAALIAVYAFKYSSEQTASQKAGLQRQIQRQEADLSLLQADWAYLNQPGNVAPIIVRHEADLKLQTLQQNQFGTFATLPMRMKAPDTSALSSLFQSLESGVDPLRKLIKESN